MHRFKFEMMTFFPSFFEMLQKNQDLSIYCMLIHFHWQFIKDKCIAFLWSYMANATD